MAELSDVERVRMLTERLALPEGALQPELALEALRHGSFVHERGNHVRSNERLEFLGDAVLGFAVAQRCWRENPDAPEGELTRMRASLVREEALAVAARRIGLGELLLLGRGEQRTGGRDNPGRLADALEAVIACVFLSCGIERAQEVVDRVLAPLFGQAQVLGRDPKTELQQLFQSRRRAPQYHVLGVRGPDHARSYEVEVRLDNQTLGRGAGKSKKEAEQAAALAALNDLTLLERALVDETVVLAPWEPRFRALFDEEAQRLRAALGAAVVAIEHVGSTAVEGLEGKPIVDLMLGVRVLDPALRLAEYESLGEAGVPGRLYYRRRGHRSFNAHVVLHGGELWRDNLLVRDFLRAHADERRRYAERKRAWIESGATMLQRYSAEKAPFIGELVERARAWATSGAV